MFCKNGLFLVFLTLCLLPKFSLRLHFAYVNAFTVTYSFCECLSHAFGHPAGAGHRTHPTTSCRGIRVCSCHVHRELWEPRRRALMLPRGWGYRELFNEASWGTGGIG